jgi:hypothetical protein
VIDGAIVDVVGLVGNAGFAGTVPDRGALGLAIGSLAIGGLAIGGKSTKLTIWGRLGAGGGDGMGTHITPRCSKVAKPTAMGEDRRSGRKREICRTVLRTIINNFHANSDRYDLAALTFLDPKKRLPENLETAYCC